MGGGVARKVLRELAYHNRPLEEVLAQVAGDFLATERTDRRIETRQHIEIALANLKRIFRLVETLATTLAKLTARTPPKVMAYTYAFLVNRLLSRTQGRIKDLSA